MYRLKHTDYIEDCNKKMCFEEDTIKVFYKLDEESSDEIVEFEGKINWFESDKMIVYSEHKTIDSVRDIYYKDIVKLIKCN